MIFVYSSWFSRYFQNIFLIFFTTLHFLPCNGKQVDMGSKKKDQKESQLFFNSSVAMTAFDLNHDEYLDSSEFELLVQSLYPDDKGASKIFNSTTTLKLFHTFDVIKPDGLLTKAEFGQLFDQWLEKVVRPKTALLIIDVQNDFMSGGALPIPHAEEIMQPINQLLELELEREEKAFDHTYFVVDWHPSNHISFVDNVGLRKLAKNSPIQDPSKARLYDTVVFEGLGEQTLWPPHAVQNSWGAQIPSAIGIKGQNSSESRIFMRKGTKPDVDSYSAILDARGAEATELARILKENDVTNCYLVGMATDVCLGETALDLLHLGFGTIVVDDAVRGINLKNSETKKNLIKKEHGVIVQTVDEVKNMVANMDLRPELGLQLALKILKK